MDKISLPKASTLTSPNPVALVCTTKKDNHTNLATVSWWTYLSFNPEMIAFAMMKSSYSGEMVREHRKVILSIPGTDLSQTVIKCGSHSGRNIDKVKEFNIQMQSIPNADIQIPLHSKLAICCSLKDYVEVGDHYLYICNVENVYANDTETAVYAWNGYAEIRPANKG